MTQHQWFRGTLVLALGLRLTPSAYAQFSHHQTSCLGNPHAQTWVIYLHGMDTDLPSPEERRNRETLSKLAEKLNLRIALPRSIHSCASSRALRCWKQGNKQEVQETWVEIHAASHLCFEPGVPQPGIIGFSNGGFFAGKALQNCLAGATPWILSASGSGSWSLHDNRRLDSCGQLTLLAGKKDATHFESAHRYFDRLLLQKANVRWEEYEGDASSLSYSVLLKALRSLISRNPPARLVAGAPLRDNAQQ